jgi:cysteine desulfurase/selenocysteine lyase
MPPSLGGGEMIDTVELQSSTYALPPSKFEPGTPPIAGVVGLAAACDYLTSIGLERIHQHQKTLGSYLYEQLASVKGARLLGPHESTGRRTGLVSFSLNNSLHSEKELAALLDAQGIAIRSGHFCTQPLHTSLGIKSSMRASLYFYNSKAEVDAFIAKLIDAVESPEIKI